MRFSKILIIAAASILLFAGFAFAEEGVAAAASSGLGDFGAKLALGLAVVGGAFGQGKIISSALESIARNPGASSQMFLVWFLGLAFVESLVILSFLISAKFLG